MNRNKCVGVLFSASAAFALSACLVWLSGCTQYRPSELDGLNSANVVLDIEKDKLNFSLGMEIDSTDIVVRCNCVAGDGVSSVRITREDIESGRVTHTAFDTSVIGNRTVTVSLLGKDFPIEYSVDEYALNLYLDDGETAYRAFDQSDMGAYLSDDLALVCGVDLNEYNYAVAEGEIDVSDRLKFCGWYDAEGNARTGRCYLSVPESGNRTVLDLYAGYLSDAELANYNMEYRNGQKTFLGYRGTDKIEGGVLVIPESVTEIDFRAVVEGEGLPYSVVDFPSTAALPFPLSGRIASPSLTELRVDGGHVAYSSYDGAIYNKSGTTLYYMPSGKTQAQLSENLRTVSTYACANSAVAEVRLPESVRVLENFCFAFSALSELYGLEKANTVMSTAFYETPYEDRSGEIDEQYSALYTKVYDAATQALLGYNLRRVDDKSITSFTARPDTIAVSGDAFINCKELVSVDLGSRVTSIGTSAFSGCSKLQSVTGLESVREAGGSLFADCTSLQAIAFPDVTFVNGTASYPHTLPNRTFYGCTALTSVTLSSETVRIGSEAFRSCTNLNALPFESLPALTEIGTRAFNACGIGEAVFPASLARIGSYAFYNSALAQVDFTQCDGLEEFIAGISMSGASYIFANTRLTRVTLPRNLKAIPATCFYNCKLLTGIAGGEGVEWIGKQAFRDCTLLSVFDFESMTALQTIEGSAFGNTGLISVTLSDSVETVGAQAFGTCGALTQFHLGAGVKTFGTYALTGNDFTSRNPVFLNTVNLQSITVSEENPYFSAEDGVLYGSLIGGVSYGEDSLLVCVPAQYPNETFTPLDSVQYILPYAIINQAVLKTVELNFGVKNIGTAAFYGSQNLTTLIVSGSVEHIGANIVSNCRNFSEIFIHKSNRIYASSDDGHFIYKAQNRELILTIAPPQNVVIEEGTQSIASGVFMNTDIESVVIANSVQTIGSKAFYGCLYLTSVSIGSGLVSYEADAFGELISLETVTVSEQNTAFAVQNGCLYSKDGKTLYLVPAANGMTEIDVTGVEKIADWAAGYHQTLKDVKMTDGLLTIGDYAFYECREIEALRFPESLREIGRWAFSFDATVDPANSNERRKCDTLKYVILDCTDIAIDVTAFEGQYGIEYLFLTFRSITDVTALMGKVGDYLANGCPMSGGGGVYNKVVRCLYAQSNDALTQYDDYVWWHYDADGNPVLWEQESL